MGSEGTWPSDTEQGPWSTWGIRLAAIVSVAMVVSLGWAWLEQFYRSVAVNAQLSFQAGDQPYMPLHTIAKPIIGNHYFGDYQLEIGFAQNLRHSMSPYFFHYRPDPALPFTQVFFTMFSFLPLQFGAFLYLVLSGGVFLVPLWLMLAPLRPAYRILFLTPVAVLTTPFISLLDRGNDIGFAAGLVAWAILAWKSERWVLCGALLVATIALKEYPVVVLVVPLALRRYKFTAYVVASVAVVNLLALLAFPGGYFRNLREMIPAALSQQDWYPRTEALLSWSLYSVIPKTGGLLFGPSAANRLLVTHGILVWLPSLLFLCGLFFVIRRGRVPQWCWGPLTLASIQLILPLAFAYSTAWAPIAAVWFAWGFMIDIRSGEKAEEKTKEWVTLRIMLLLALTASLVPSVFTIGTISTSGPFTTPLAEYLSPVLIFITLCTALIQSVRPMTRTTVPMPMPVPSPLLDPGIS